MLDKNLTSFVEVVSNTIDAIEIFDTKNKIKDLKNPEICSIEKGEIKLDKISFTYPKGEHVFEKFNLQIPAGQSIGIVGKSGSGKTTLTKLLLRFYDISDGEILIDNQDISKVKRNDLRLKMAYIPQETILFHRSIYENIAYGNLEASEEEVILASKAAYVDEFVQNLEQKYETEVGERGIKLSGGQRQRIGIARAMLRKNAPLLILDEATSSLDSMSEHYIQKSFKELSKDRTTIVIAHRLSTIQQLDRIIVMDKGKIVEDGSHDELIAKNGHYAELWNSQVNGFILEE
jgi:ATP-binding cassette subfamily B protein